MWAKGRQPGFGIKAEVLKKYPRLICRRVESIHGIRGYIVYDGNEAIASASTALGAWGKVDARMQMKK